MVPSYVVVFRRPNIVPGEIKTFGWWITDHIKHPYRVISGMGEQLNVIDTHMVPSIYSVWLFTDAQDAETFRDKWGGEDYAQ